MYLTTVLFRADATNIVFFVFQKTDAALLEEITDADKNLAREVWMQVEGNYIVVSKALFSE